MACTSTPGGRRLGGRSGPAWAESRLRGSRPGPGGRAAAPPLPSGPFGRVAASKHQRNSAAFAIGGGLRGTPPPVARLRPAPGRGRARACRQPPWAPPERPAGAPAGRVRARPPPSVGALGVRVVGLVGAGVRAAGGIVSPAAPWWPLLLSGHKIWNRCSIPATRCGGLLPPLPAPPPAGGREVGRAHRRVPL